MNRIFLLSVLAVWVWVAQASGAEPLKIGVGLDKPPYVIQQTGGGFELEIVSRALEIAGYKMIPRYMPLKRIPYELNAGTLDGGMHMRAHMSIDGFFSNDVIFYRNYAITLKNSNIRLKEMEDLARYSVVAFQNAEKLLGYHFAKVISRNSKYTEISNQELQVKMLMAGRTQVVVSDFRIFLHFKKKVEEELGKKIDVDFYSLFAPTPYRVAFRDRTIRDAFDASMTFLKASGEYKKIIEKYLSEEDLDQF